MVAVNSEGVKPKVSKLAMRTAACAFAEVIPPAEKRTIPCSVILTGGADVSAVFTTAFCDAMLVTRTVPMEVPARAWLRFFTNTSLLGCTNVSSVMDLATASTAGKVTSYSTFTLLLVEVCNLRCPTSCDISRGASTAASRRPVTNTRVMVTIVTSTPGTRTTMLNFKTTVTLGSVKNPSTKDAASVTIMASDAANLLCRMTADVVVDTADVDEVLMAINVDDDDDVAEVVDVCVCVAGRVACVACVVVSVWLLDVEVCVAVVVLLLVVLVLVELVNVVLVTVFEVVGELERVEDVVLVRVELLVVDVLVTVDVVEVVVLRVEVEDVVVIVLDVVVFVVVETVLELLVVDVVDVRVAVDDEVVEVVVVACIVVKHWLEYSISTGDRGTDMDPT